MRKEISMKLNATGTGKDDPSYKIILNFNFDNCSSEQVLDWALANRVIVWQNSHRNLSPKELKAFDGKTIDCSIVEKRSKVVRPMTFDEQVSYIKTLPKSERQAKINELMKALN